MSKTTLAAQWENTKEALANTLLPIRNPDLKPVSDMLLCPYFYLQKSEHPHGSSPWDDPERKAIQGSARCWLKLVYE